MVISRCSLYMETKHRLARYQYITVSPCFPLSPGNYQRNETVPTQSCPQFIKYIQCQDRQTSCTNQQLSVSLNYLDSCYFIDKGTICSSALNQGDIFHSKKINATLVGVTFETTKRVVYGTLVTKSGDNFTRKAEIPHVHNSLYLINFYV